MLNTSSSSYFIDPLINKGKLFHVRYIKSKWKNLNDYIFFIDDDLLDFSVLKTIPVSYAFRIFFKIMIWRFRLRSYAEIWISSPYLAEKYQAYKPKLLRPVASGELLSRQWEVIDKNPNNSPIRICYHGTWSHRDDMKWLVPVIAEVQSKCPNTIFEVIGGKKVGRLFKGIPRVDVLDVMTWPEYLSHTQNRHQDIGLAPLLDTLFNRARGPIKFFDYARCGAVGIYSKSNAFNSFVDDGADGFLLDNSHALWVDTIISLVNAPNKRLKMAEAAWRKVLQNSPQSSEIQKYLKSF